MPCLAGGFFGWRFTTSLNRAIGVSTANHGIHTATTCCLKSQTTASDRMQQFSTWLLHFYGKFANRATPHLQMQAMKRQPKRTFPIPSPWHLVHRKAPDLTPCNSSQILTETPYKKKKLVFTWWDIGHNLINKSINAKPRHTRRNSHTAKWHPPAIRRNQGSRSKRLQPLNTALLYRDLWHDRKMIIRQLGKRVSIN